MGNTSDGSMKNCMRFTAWSLWVATNYDEEAMRIADELYLNNQLILLKIKVFLCFKAHHLYSSPAHRLFLSKQPSKTLNKWLFINELSKSRLSDERCVCFYFMCVFLFAYLPSDLLFSWLMFLWKSGYYAIVIRLFLISVADVAVSQTIVMVRLVFVFIHVFMRNMH